MESHGGTTFCALAALQLSDQMHLLSSRQLEKMKRWLLFRQEGGFQGRPNKPIDTCYSFWIGAALKIVEAFELSNFKENKDYILSCQDTVVGGFSKWPGTTSDPFHTYFGLCGLSFLHDSSLGLLEVMPSLNISVRAYKKLGDLHKLWELNSNVQTVQLNID
jgi:geranylgeranyl transferase type-1 subunit beta